jgi:hypothetical protein
MKKPQMGRPPKEEAERLAKIVQFRLTTEEYGDCQKAATKADIALSAWIRERLVRSAKRELKN